MQYTQIKYTKVFLEKRHQNTEIFLNDKKLKAKMKYADKLEIPYVIVVGEDEVNTGIVKIKNMKTGEQVERNIEEITKKDFFE